MLNLSIVFAQADEGGGGGIAALLVPLIALAVAIFIIAGMWKMYAKAGQPGWACIIPIYNFVALLQIVGRPLWWILLLFIPLVNLIILLIVFIDLAKSFGKGTGFGLGLFFLGAIFMPILGFGDAKYIGPAGANAH
jgi:hypothetical protein